jgi:uncharacterized protein YjiS (DUF1127 family)
VTHLPIPYGTRLAPPPQRSSAAGPFERFRQSCARIVAAPARLLREHRALRRLEELGDRDLADLGLTRGDVSWARGRLWSGSATRDLAEDCARRRAAARRRLSA